MVKPDRVFLWAIPAVLLLVLVLFGIALVVGEYQSNRRIKEENQRNSERAQKQVEFEKMLDELFPSRNGNQIDWDSVTKEINRPQNEKSISDERKQAWENFKRKWRDTKSTSPPPSR